MTVFDFNTVYYGVVQVFADDSVNIYEGPSPIEGYGFAGKYALANCTYDNPGKSIQRSCVDQLGTHITKLFIAKKSKLSRDLIRNSGYTITRSPEDANTATVIPAANFPRKRFSYDLCFMRGEDLYLFRVQKAYFGSEDDDSTNDQRNNVEKYFNDRYCSENIDFVWADDNRYMCFIPKVDEYLDILSGTYPRRVYIQDFHLTIKPNNPMTVEVLDIMARIKDDTMLAKTILNNDYQNYPFCILLMLQIAHPYFSLYSDPQCRVALESIGYKDFDYERYSKILVSPADWELSQKWLLHHYGIPEDGGLVSQEKFNSMDAEFLRRRVLIKPLKISETMDLQNILELVKN